MDDVLARIGAEAGGLAFRINKDAWMSIDFAPETVYPWTGHDSAMITALTVVANRDRYVSSLFDIIGILDTRIAAEFSWLRLPARDAEIPLRCGLFANNNNKQHSD